MKSKSLIALLTFLCFITLSVNAQTKTKKADCIGEDECCKKPSVKKVVNTKSINTMTNLKQDKVVSCKLTSPELQKRKAEVIALLKANVLERKEVTNGYQYSFKGFDKILDDLVSFIKTERACCDFFTFKLAIEDEATNVLLTITGPKGAREFINAEMEL